MTVFVLSAHGIFRLIIDRSLLRDKLKARTSHVNVPRFDNCSSDLNDSSKHDGESPSAGRHTVS